MMTIRSDDGSIIETVIAEGEDQPMVRMMNLFAFAGKSDQWECFLTIVHPQGGTRIHKARVIRLELDLEVDE